MDIVLIVLTGLFAASAVGIGVLLLAEWVDRRVTARFFRETVVKVPRKFGK